MDENAQAAVVLRYRNGATSRSIEIPEIDAGAQTVRLAGSEISFDELKAVFFLKDQAAAPVEGAHTSVVSVEFDDGEIIRGQAYDYNPLASGFFLSPVDETRNGRIFVVAAAVVAIEVEKL